MMKFLPFLTCLILCFTAASSQSQPQSCSSSVHNITMAETVLDTAVTHVHWLPRPDDKTIFVRLYSGAVWRSTDGGVEWSNELKRMHGSESPVEGAGTGVFKMASSPVDSCAIYFIGYGTVQWATSDGGVSYQVRDSGLDLYSILFHPTKPTHLLGLTERKCLPDEGSLAQCYDLYMTKDVGAKWMLVSTNVHQNNFEWLGNDGILAMIVSPTSSSSVVFFHEDKDSFTQTVVVEPPVGGLSSMGKFVFASQGAQTQSQSLMVGIGGTDNRVSFKKAVLPSIVKLHQHRYTILDASGESVMLQVTNTDGISGDVFGSDSSGSRYSLSLGNVAIQAEYIGEKTKYGQFVRFKGLEGTFVANVNVETGTVTRITFDHGATWESLVLANTKETLHLHTIMLSGRLLTNARYPPLYSTGNAVGIMIGAGNVGPSLDTTSDTAKLYFTRDGGHTWSQIHDEFSTKVNIDGAAEMGTGTAYQVGDRGGIIVSAFPSSSSSATSEINYSLDEGLSWSTCKMASQDFTVKEIYAEPLATGRSFLLIGSRKKTPPSPSEEPVIESVLVALNFSSIHERVCDTDDYEWWFAQGSVKERYCMLGKHSTFLRRKRDSKCLIELDTAAVRKSTPCKCDESDYECDICYSRDSITAPCMLDTRLCPNGALPPDTTVCENPNVTTYYESYGYRRIPGDVCTGPGVTGIEPRHMSCHESAWLWLLLLPVVLVTGVGLFKVGIVKSIVELCCGKRGGRKQRRRRGRGRGRSSFPFPFRLSSSWSDEWWSGVFYSIERIFGVSRSRSHGSGTTSASTSASNRFRQLSMNMDDDDMDLDIDTGIDMSIVGTGTGTNRLSGEKEKDEDGGEGGDDFGVVNVNVSAERGMTRRKMGTGRFTQNGIEVEVDGGGAPAADQDSKPSSVNERGSGGEGDEEESDDDWGFASGEMSNERSSYLQ